MFKLKNFELWFFNDCWLVTFLMLVTAAALLNQRAHLLDLTLLVFLFISGWNLHFRFKVCLFLLIKSSLSFNVLKLLSKSRRKLSSEFATTLIRIHFNSKRANCWFWLFSRSSLRVHISFEDFKWRLITLFCGLISNLI